MNEMFEQPGMGECEMDDRSTAVFGSLNLPFDGAPVRAS
jgi:hypothetical protein